MPGIEPGAFHMQSERSTTELHPPCNCNSNFICCGVGSRPSSGSVCTEQKEEKLTSVLPGPVALAP